MKEPEGKACLIAGIQIDQIQQTLEDTMGKYHLHIHSDHTSFGSTKGDPNVAIFTSRWDDKHRYIGVVVQEILESAEPLDMIEAESTLARVKSEGLDDAQLYVCVYRT